MRPSAAPPAKLCEYIHLGVSMPTTRTSRPCSKAWHCAGDTAARSGIGPSRASSRRIEVSSAGGAMSSRSSRRSMYTPSSDNKMVLIQHAVSIDSRHFQNSPLHQRRVGARAAGVGRAAVSSISLVFQFPRAFDPPNVRDPARPRPDAGPWRAPHHAPVSDRGPRMHAPVSAARAARIEHLDALRGLALLGIAVVDIGVYAAQLWLSRAWLRRFAYGPVEWLLRAATIGAWPRMGKAAY
ncbi:DUF418 domain-containing protein [Lysobacter enzymogenes]|uniref:DUF418 domain-containing protein n=2 Tax=Lysobacter enzymogenes TaxID=69 RepID=A0A3N2RKP3_LYSEN|nr:DUF418 domain-containing protein [Lysobacter enzymogenes]